MIIMLVVGFILAGFILKSKKVWPIVIITGFVVAYNLINIAFLVATKSDGIGMYLDGFWDGIGLGMSAFMLFIINKKSSLLWASPTVSNTQHGGS